MTIAILGGGPAGMTLALALAHKGMAATILEARRRNEVLRDARILALAQPSADFLARLCAWPGQATPITSVHVSQAGLGHTRIDAADVGLSALGQVVTASDLIEALFAAIDAAGIAYREGESEAPTGALVVHAEGRVAEEPAGIHRDYQQCALITRLTPVTSHRNRAWERFTATGPIALLPHRDDYAAIIVCPATQAETLAALPSRALIELIETRFAHRLRFSTASPARAYPLVLRARRTVVGIRSVWIGNAAQTLHPVGGQGFNLALRDIAELADTLADAPDPGAPEVLARYTARRRLDRWATIGFTDLLARGFLGNSPPLSSARAAALSALDLCAPARRFLARRLVYGARAW